MYRVTITSTKPLFISISQSFDDCYKDIVRLMKIFKQPKPEKPEQQDLVEFSCGEYQLKIERV